MDLDQQKGGQVNQPNTTDSQAIERHNMSHLMIKAAESDVSNSPGIKPDQHVITPAVIVHRPLMECYPEMADDEHEQLLADVRRHWLGRFFIIFGGIGLAILVLVFAASIPWLLRTLGYGIPTETKGLIAMIFIALSALIVVATLIQLWVYNQSRMLITDQNVIEIKQMSLFSHKVSHLNMLNVEDVSVVKKGILPTVFDYGTMTIETAGEAENFVFVSTPTPDKYRRMVINAHEVAINRIGQMGAGQRVEVAHNGL